VTKERRSAAPLRFVFVACVSFIYATLALAEELDLALVSSTYSAPLDSVKRLLSVPADGTLQVALENARPGDIIELQRGGAPLSPAGAAAAWIEIRSLSPAARSNERRVYTAVPQAPLVDSEVARAAPLQLEYDTSSRVYSRGRAAPHRALSSPVAIGLGAERSSVGKRGWPMRGQDAANTGHTAASGPVVQTEVRWTFRPDARTLVWRPAVAEDGTIYVTTALFVGDGVDGRLYALWPDGSVKWQVPLTNSSGLGVWTSATPVVDRDGNVYVAWAHDVGFGGLTAISFTSSGSVRWRFEPNIELETASHQQPALGRGVLYAAADTSFFFDDPTHRASIFALDLTTGTPLWQWTSPNLDTFFDGPVVGHDGYLYHASASNPVRGASGHLYRIRASGELDWSVDVGAGASQAPPIDARNNIYLGDRAGVVSKYNSAGDLLWTYDTLSGQISGSPVLADTRVTVGAPGGLHVLDAATGARRSLLAPGEYPFGQASDRAGNAFVYSFNASGTVFGFGRGGRQWWRFETGLGSTVNAVAIAGDGSLLVSNGDDLQAYVAPVLGDLNCDGTGDELDITPFVLAVIDPSRYAQHYPQCHRLLADVNGDGRIDTFDLVPFLSLVGRGTTH
jgi:hypothetical protein